MGIVSPAAERADCTLELVRTKCDTVLQGRRCGTSSIIGAQGLVMLTAGWVDDDGQLRRSSKRTGKRQGGLVEDAGLRVKRMSVETEMGVPSVCAIL